MVKITEVGIKKDLILFIRKTKKLLPDAKILLFGSRARKDNLVESDIDILIISKKFEKMHYLDRISLVVKHWSGLVTLECICLTPLEFVKRRNEISIIGVAAKEGIEI